LYAKGEVTHEVGINEFSDWTPAELEGRLIPNASPFKLSDSNTFKVDPSYYAAVPATFDWRSTNNVTPVKNQGKCGSCWAFAAIATTEAAYSIKNSQTLDLSEQQLTDCCGSTYQCQGCKGGQPSGALKCIQQLGVENTADYKYTGANESCANNAAKTHTKIVSYASTSRPSDDTIKAAIYAHGPVVIELDGSGSDFQSYKSGIITTGSKTINHAVTAVGWGTNYFIVKNSWGTSWGQSGYFWLGQGNNVRGYNSAETVYPTV